MRFVGAGERKPAQQNTPAGAVLTAALRTAVPPGETERTERVEERGGGEETGGQAEGAAAGVGPREGQRASGEGTSPVCRKSHTASLLIRMLPLAQYVTQTVEVESPATLKHLSKARQRGELLSEKLAKQNERCKQLEEQIRKSDEHSCNLQHKVTEGSPSTLNPSEQHSFEHDAAGSSTRTSKNNVP